MQSSCNWLQTFNMFCSIKSVVVTVVSRVHIFFSNFCRKSWCGGNDFFSMNRSPSWLTFRWLCPNMVEKGIWAGTIEYFKQGRGNGYFTWSIFGITSENKHPSKGDGFCKISYIVCADVKTVSLSWLLFPDSFDDNCHLFLGVFFRVLIPANPHQSITLLSRVERWTTEFLHEPVIENLYNPWNVDFGKVNCLIKGNHNIISWDLSIFYFLYFRFQKF